MGTDLVVMGEAKPVGFKVSKSSTLKDFKISLAKQMVVHFSNVTHMHTHFPGTYCVVYIIGLSSAPY